jgi:hypothetical protein
MIPSSLNYDSQRILQMFSMSTVNDERTMIRHGESSHVNPEPGAPRYEAEAEANLCWKAFVLFNFTSLQASTMTIAVLKDRSRAEFLSPLQPTLLVTRMSHTVPSASPLCSCHLSCSPQVKSLSMLPSPDPSMLLLPSPSMFPTLCQMSMLPSASML